MACLFTDGTCSLSQASRGEVVGVATSQLLSSGHSGLQYEAALPASLASVMQQLEQRMSEQLSDMQEEMYSRLDELGTRVKGLEARLGALERYVSVWSGRRPEGLSSE